MCMLFTHDSDVPAPPFATGDALRRSPMFEVCVPFCSARHGAALVLRRCLWQMGRAPLGWVLSPQVGASARPFGGPLRAADGP